MGLLLILVFEEIDSIQLKILAPVIISHDRIRVLEPERGVKIGRNEPCPCGCLNSQRYVVTTLDKP